MFSRKRVAFACCVFAGVGWMSVALTLADPPASDPKSLPLPDLPDLEVQQSQPIRRNPQVEKKIRDAIENGDFQETGDPVLDDLLKFMRENSVLRNTSLDPALDSPGATTSARARAAESLLKSARLLEKIESSDKTRQDLVNQLRSEAVRLLRQ